MVLSITDSDRSLNSKTGCGGNQTDRSRCCCRLSPGPAMAPGRLPLLVRRPVVKDAPRPSAASAADSVGAFLSWLLCIQPVSLQVWATEEMSQ